MYFRRISKPRDHLSRRGQWRLLSLVLSLGLVVVLMVEARDPNNWAWLVAPGDGGDGPPSQPASGGDPPTGGLSGPMPSNEAVPGAPDSPAAEQSEQAPGARSFPGVKPEDFDAVRDDTRFRPQEQEAWFQLLETLDSTDETTLRRGSTGRVTYVQLFRQSDQYRGELVTIRGTVRRAHYLSAPENDSGIPGYYQTWVEPESRSLPMVVYCLHLPEGFPTGMDVAADVEIDGFYFKRWAYEARDAVRVAPVLLARSVRWHRAPPAPENPPASAGSLAAMVAGTLGVSLLVAFWVYRRTRRGRSIGPGEPPQFDGLSEAGTGSSAGLPRERTV